MSAEYNPFALAPPPPKKPFGDKRPYSTRPGSKKAKANDEGATVKGAFHGIDASGVAIQGPPAPPADPPTANEQPADGLPMYARRNASGLYTWKGVQHPSVTTIIGPYGGEGLMIWYASMAVEDCIAQLDRLGEGRLSLEAAHEAIRDIQTRKTAAIRYRDFKGAIGTLTHHALYERVCGVSQTEMTDYLEHFALKFDLAHPDRDVEGSEPYSLTLAKAALPYVRNAFRWLDDKTPDFEAIGQEAVVVNPDCGYAGTIDAIAKIDGRKYAIDFKTSTSIREFSFRMQVEAYRRASFIGLMADGSEHPVPETDAVGILHIKPLDPCELQTFEPSDLHYEAFLSLRHVYAVVNGLKAAKRQARAENAKPPKKDPNVCPFGANL